MHRRRFLKGIGTLVAGPAAAAILSGCGTSIPEPETVEPIKIPEEPKRIKLESTDINQLPEGFSLVVPNKYNPRQGPFCNREFNVEMDYSGGLYIKSPYSDGIGRVGFLCYNRDGVNSGDFLYDVSLFQGAYFHLKKGTVNLLPIIYIKTEIDDGGCYHKEICYSSKIYTIPPELRE